MSNLNVNLEKASKKWGKLIESFGVNDKSKIEWMSEYATYHATNESVAYANGTNVSGMGAVVSPVASNIPGQTIGGYATGDSFGTGGIIGSGDLGQSLIPAAMKIAAQTIGLELVAVKPTPGPVIDLVFVDYRYDDGALSTNANYIPVIFQLDAADADAQAVLDATQVSIRTFLAANAITEIQGGLSQRVFMNVAGGSVVTASTATVEPTIKTSVVEFLGFSRVNKNPMFKAYRTTNAVNTIGAAYDANNNTFGVSATVIGTFQGSVGGTAATSTTVGSAFNGTAMTIGFSNTSWDATLSTPAPKATNIKVDLVSALEDHIFGASSSNGNNPMTREQDDNFYAGVIAPNVQTKRVQVGTIEVSSALRLSEIEDIKSQTGIDIVSKVEGVLANELSQNISKEIVGKIKAFGALNAKTAPLLSAGVTMFDFNVDAYLATNAPGGETKQSLQNGLVTKVRNASNYIFTEGRIGQATFAVTNSTLAVALTQGAQYELSKFDNSTSNSGQLYPAGKVAGITVYVDPYQSYNDMTITLGRKNNPDQPGIIFVPYLMAQTVKIVSEATWAPRMLMRSRYAVTEVGYYPQKQYLTIKVTDSLNRLA